MRISFFFLNIFVIKDKKIKNIVIILLNLITIVLFIVVIIIILVKKDNLIARIINLDYCLFLFLSSLASILYIKAEVKKKKNVMQNIEEIINFTEINQHANEKKFENEYFKDVLKKKRNTIS
jgi:predicted membrane channel-forming protein YqfA (hemolysin III family)